MICMIVIICGIRTSTSVQQSIKSSSYDKIKKSHDKEQAISTDEPTNEDQPSTTPSVQTTIQTKEPTNLHQSSTTPSVQPIIPMEKTIGESTNAHNAYTFRSVSISKDDQKWSQYDQQWFKSFTNAGIDKTGDDHIKSILEGNRNWVRKQNEKDPTFFENLGKPQTPKFLYFGCSDSRVPANEILGKG